MSFSYEAYHTTNDTHHTVTTEREHISSMKINKRTVFSKPAKLYP
jgi:hypothetical protein